MSKNAKLLTVIVVLALALFVWQQRCHCVGSTCPPALALPDVLDGKVVSLKPTDVDFYKANIPEAVHKAGKGGISDAIVVQLAKDLTVYRMWNGPATKEDETPETNLYGRWWAYDRPQGTVDDYRQHYEVCKSWNKLTHVATCHLSPGSVIAIGPGQSVTPPTCGDADNKESYPADAQHWQVYVNDAKASVKCDDGFDYEADPKDIAVKKAAP